MAADRKLVVLLLFWVSTFFPLLAMAQEDGVRYVVKDAKTSMPISGAIVSYTHNHKVNYLETREDGLFLLPKEIAKCTLTIQHVSYQNKRIQLDQVEHYQIFLIPIVQELEEVTVYSNQYERKGNIYSATPMEADLALSVVGERDILRQLSILPGVSQGIEGSLGLFVRGGNSGGNGLYLGDVPMYISSHILGALSVYPAEMIEHSDFYTGGIPAERGNLSASLLDVKIKSSVDNHFGGKVVVSPLISSAYTSIPIIKDRVTMRLSGRNAIAPYFLPLVMKSSDNDLRMKLYDVAGSIHYKIANNHQLEAFFFRTEDKLQFTTPTVDEEVTYNAQGWAGTSAKLGWLGQLSEQLLIKAWGYYTKGALQQEHQTSRRDKINSTLGTASGIEEWSIQVKGEYAFNNYWKCKGGIGYQDQLFSPTNSRLQKEEEEEVIDLYDREFLPSQLLTLFLEGEYHRPQLLDIRLGYRHTFQHTGLRDRLSNFDLHLLAQYYLNRHWGLAMSLDRANQFYHVLEGLPTGWSVNIMVPSSPSLPMETTHQAYLGLFWAQQLRNIAVEASLGGYYKQMKHLISYRSPTNAFGIENKSWKEDLDIGKGTSYGLELSTKVTNKWMTANLAYTLSKTNRHYSLINKGEPFPFKFDRRHILNMHIATTLAKRTNKKGVRLSHHIGSSLTYSSGNRTTLELGYYEGAELPFWEMVDKGGYPREFLLLGTERQLMSGMNAITMKDYFRIDLSYQFKAVGKRVTNELAFSIYNLLNRHNPYSYYQQEEKWMQLSILPIVPSLSWSISW